MELYQLYTFVAVAREGSLRKASQRLHMTSPTASGHIKALEEEFQITLFKRNPNGMELTVQGKELLKQAKEIIASARRLKNQVNELKNSVSGELIIGLNAPPEFLRVAELAAELRKKPNIRIVFEPSSTGKIIDNLCSKDFDAGFVFSPFQAKNLVSICLGSFDLCIAIPSAFDSKFEPNSWEDLAQLPWVCSDGYCPFQNIITNLFERRGLALKNTISTNDEMTKLDFVRRGLGVALLLKDECNKDLSDGKIKVWNTEPVRCDLYFAYPADRQDDPVFRILREAIHTVWDRVSY